MPKRERRPRVRKTLISLPEDLFTALRHYAVEKDTTVSEIIVDLLQRVPGLKKWRESGKEDKEA